MKNKFKIKTSLLMVLILITSSCSKDSVAGETGPQGIQGEQGIQGDKGEGEQGVQGEQGTPGENGQDGNANVRSKILTLTNTDWLFPVQSIRLQNGRVIQISQARYVDLDVPELTEDMDQNGMILLFIKLRSGGSWQPLPYENDLGDFYEYIRYETSIGKIQLQFGWFGNNPPLSSALETYVMSDYPIKYILVEGNAIGKTKVTIKQLKKMSYEEVMDYFDLDY